MSRILNGASQPQTKLGKLKAIPLEPVMDFPIIPTTPEGGVIVTYLRTPRRPSGRPIAGTRANHSTAVLAALLLVGVAFSLPVSAAEPLATAYTNWDDVTLDLMTVERRGNVLTVKWAVNNEGDTRVTVTFVLTGAARTYVVDEESGTKFFVLTDKEGACLASQSAWQSGGYGISDRLEAGKTKRYWMKLPAPAPEVKEVTVFFNRTEPLEGIAITDR